jgi:predicted dehydrogenase
MRAKPMNKKESSTNPILFPRRFFIKTTAGLAAAAGLPKWFLDETQVQGATKEPGPNDQPAVALVGCGGQGRGDANNAKKYGRIVAVCDVDDANLAQGKKMFPDAKEYRDFREVMARDDIHAIVCGTVDHWHTLVSMAAMKSGKDVYCEKPLTLCIDEGKHLVKTMRETKRILQVGSQQRSDRRFRLACELVRNGRIGKLKHIDVWLPSGPVGGPFPSRLVPQGLNWDFWLGQTPKVEYVKERCHATFRYWWEYSGGTMTDWGAHHNDIALWGLGLDRSGPVTVEGRQIGEMIAGGYTASAEYEVNFTYENGVTQSTRSTDGDTPYGGKTDKNPQRNGVKFHGSDGWIWVTRGDLEASKPEILEEKLPSSAVRLYESGDHMRNFFDCIRSRKQPICDAEIGHRSVTVCHLGVIAVRLGRKLQWDPKKEKFVNDSDANNWLARPMRKGYGYDFIA